MTLYKDKYTGKWVKGHPYMQWPTDKDGHNLMPGELGWFKRRIHHYEYEYLIPGSGGDTGMATERREVEDTSRSRITPPSFRERLDAIQAAE